MKRFVNIFTRFCAVAFVAAILLSACTKQAVTPVVPQIKCLQSNTGQVSLSTVYSLLNTGTRAALTKVSEPSVEPVIIGKDTVFYIVNYADGWELLSGAMNASMVLMQSDHGHLSAQDLSSNPSLQYFMDQVAESVSCAIHDETTDPSGLFSDTWYDFVNPGNGPGPLDSLYTVVIDSVTVNTLETRSVGPLLSTHWGQSSPWNDAMPYMSPLMTTKCYAGCVPVATGQILYYLHDKLLFSANAYSSATCNAYIPTGYEYITLSPSDASFYNGSNSHWDDMALTSSSSSGFDEVSALLLELGIKYGAKYYTNGTGAQTAYATTVFPQYGISCSSTLGLLYAPFINCCETEIYGEELPILMSVVDATSGGGHAIVIDGYKYVKTHDIIHCSYYDGNQLILTIDNFGDIHESRFITINWGWNGIYNSTPTNIIWYNVYNDWVVGNYNYSSTRLYVHGFELI